MPTPPPPRRVALPAVLIVLATLALLALSAMIVLPVTSMRMLPLAIATAELSPVLALLDVLCLAAAWRLLRGREWLQVAVALALLAAGVIAVRPLTQFAAAATREQAQLGANAASERFSIMRMLRGLPAGDGVHVRTVPYTASNGTPLAMRLYSRQPSVRRPLIVTIYGGAWRGGEPTQAASFSRALAALGYTVAAIDYRHAPSHRFPAQLDDVRLSLALLRDSASAWGIDPSRVALMGRSAGGHLAELAAFAPRVPRVPRVPRDPGDPGVPGSPSVPRLPGERSAPGAPPLPDALTIRAVIGIYAPHDLVQGYNDLPSPDPIGVRAILTDFLGGSPQTKPSGYHDASVSSFVRPGLPPTLLIFGGRDLIVKPEINRAAAARLRAAHNRVVELELPWAEHAFDLGPAGLGTQIAYRAITDFLESSLGAPLP